MHTHSRASPRERQYSILFVMGHQPEESVAGDSYVLYTFIKLLATTFVVMSLHFQIIYFARITEVKTKPMMLQGIWEQYGDRESRFRNLTREQGGI